MTNMLTKYEINANEAAKRFGDVAHMRVHHPALFSTDAHPRMSERYAFTHTYDIVKAMNDKGYCVSSIQGGETRFSRMLIRMRHEQHMYTRQGDRSDGAPEVIIIDSHDGSKSLRLALGYIKFLCMNGCIAGDMLYNKMFRHSSRDLMAQVMLEVADVEEYIETLTSNIAEMRNYRTTIGERLKLADSVVDIRFGKDRDEGFKASVRSNLLHRRRREDTAEDLHTIVNVIQENVIRGGFQYSANTTSPSRAMRKARPINAIDTNVKLNTTLWNEANALLQKAA